MQELTGAIRKGGQAQYLDKLQVERERGITVKVRHGRRGSNRIPVKCSRAGSLQRKCFFCLVRKL